MFKSIGEWRTHWLGDPLFCDEPNIARITVRIGDHDRRLIKFDNASHNVGHERIGSTTWLYLRTITPDKFRRSQNRRCRRAYERGRVMKWTKKEQAEFDRLMKMSREKIASLPTLIDDIRATVEA
jgi:hypothetical protein